MANRDQIREATFRLRYALERTAAALREFNTVYRGALEDELRALHQARKAAASRLAQEHQQREAEYQAWKRRLEDKT